MLSPELQQMKDMCRQMKAMGSRDATSAPEVARMVRANNDKMLGAIPLPEGYREEPSPFQGVAGAFYRYEGADKREGKLLYYIHGGGYENGTVLSRRFLAAGIANELKCDCFSLDYTQWPEAQHPVALFQAIAGWGAICMDYDPKDVVCAGESGGAVLILTMLNYLKDNERPLPGGVAAIGPVANAAEGYPSRTEREGIDPMLWSTVAQAGQYLWNVKDRRDPYVSPIYGDFHGFPPTIVTVGTDEVLYDDAMAIYDKLRASGVEAQIDILEGGFHAYQMFPCPESLASIATMGAFLRR